MATFTSHPHGTPSWVDLMSPDVAVAKDFYTAVFGWEPEDQTGPDGEYIYTMFRLDGKDVAGLGGQPPQMAGAPAIWNSYVSVDDAETVLGSVEAAGGTVVMPAMDVMESGRMGVMAAPDGSMISVWQAGTHIGAQVANEPDTYCWNELLSRDLPAAQGFYTEIFGWEYEQMDMGPMGTYHVIAGGDNGGLGGMMEMPAMLPDQVPNHWVVYFLVEDADATAKKIEEAGGTITMPPGDTPVGRIGNAHDPQHGSFAFMQPAAHEEG